MEEHDWKAYPELTNSEMEEFGITSPHEQITEDFHATVIKVHDGDTVTLRTDFRDFDFPLRFGLIDAPELNTGTPGEEAREWLKEQIEGQEVEVRIDPLNRVEKWGRLLGEIYYMGMNIGEMEVILGYASTYGKKNEGEAQDIEKYFAQFTIK